MRSNVRRLRPREVSLVADLLAEPADDIEELARAIIRALNDYRAREPLYARIVRIKRTTLLYGPYPSVEAAMADDASAGIGKPGQPYEVGVAPLHGAYGNQSE
jgi:hypothetical protein